jgi:hypothetical protein
VRADVFALPAHHPHPNVHHGVVQYGRDDTKLRGGNQGHRLFPSRAVSDLTGALVVLERLRSDAGA